ncbi:MAG: glycosyltransferase family 39 protein [Chloroflexota bacterium]
MPVAQARPAAGVPAVLLACVLLFILAWIPRIINVGGYLTTDEGNWMGRTALFATALTDGDPRGTYQSGHPGVMTMWLSLIGMGPDRALALAPYVTPDGLEKAPAYLETLRLARRPFTVMTSVGVVIITLLTWRMLGRGPAFATGLLLALDPFFLAHSVVAHVDSNITVWLTVSVLSAVIYFWRGGGRWFLVASGAAAGLAFLSKAPSAILPLFVPVVALSSLWSRGMLGNRAAWTRLVGDGLFWGALAYGVAALLWPSFRTDPLGTVREMVDYTEAVGGSDHENFFLGQPTGDPGPVYYLVCLAFRLTPVTLAGLLALAVFGAAEWRRGRRSWQAPVVILALFCGLFVMMMSSAPKKFDRYMLPIFPSLQILAGLGIWLSLARIAPFRQRLLLPALLAGLGLLQVLPAILVYPYYLAYYNPLLGGGQAARRSIVVGWGEGLDIVMEHLNAKPDADRLTVAGFYPRVMSAQFKGTVLSPKQFDEAMADYVVLYVNAVQRDLADRLRTITRGKRTEQVVRINGIEYARLFPIPPPPRRNAAGTEYGGVARLERTFLKSDERRNPKSDNYNPGDTLQLTLRWRAIGAVPPDTVVNVSLIRRRGGGAVVQSELPFGARSANQADVSGADFNIQSHRLALPDTVDQYSVVVGLRRGDGAWVPVTSVPERLSPEARFGPGQIVVEDVDAQ